MEALPSMMDFLRKRPQKFNSIDEAVSWRMNYCISSKTVLNIDSAKISIPSQLIQQPGCDWYTWRTNLKLTESFWKGWFEGLSSKFLSIKAAKLLILAGTDRIDKTLMIGQMQERKISNNHAAPVRTLHPGRFSGESSGCIVNIL
ncbi:Protein phosphatase methylesterase, eukaryotic domain-containing protein [Rozella allomycis CSF55]|uniref:Protein phosphatase methylesterase, eukaryotic domain-containing protein n=1 Tax=Rozella allomycis (strain CSF55) TaxID=988480 RepID=A0A075AQX9_ROZAC|nr:Protein phosphatase methylesterase, eukaryotic domain-containing protein [Rozella allomycis CSF55]|eukprot:EPZ31090.1 Protein phosphatase methylesterase, eukaryotic domain-containing protein [Rozella allomycis CSF55]